jgi:hypothetical protein
MTANWSISQLSLDMQFQIQETGRVSTQRMTCDQESTLLMFRSITALDIDSKSQNNNKSVVPEKRRVDAEEPQGKKRVQIAQAKGLTTTQSRVDVVKSKKG